MGFLVAAAVAASALVSSSSAQTLVTYMFGDQSTAAALQAPDAGSVPGNVTAGNLTHTVPTVSGQTPGFSTTFDMFFANAATLANSQPAIGATQGYLTFTLTVAEGHQLNLSGLSFKLGVSAGTAYNDATGYTTNAALRTSLDGFSTNVATVSETFTSIPAFGSNAANIMFATKNINLGAAAFQSIAGTVTFNLHLWDSSDLQNLTVRLDEIALSGTVSAIPEPSTFAALAGLVAVAAAGGARRRRR